MHLLNTARIVIVILIRVYKYNIKHNIILLEQKNEKSDFLENKPVRQ